MRGTACLGPRASGLCRLQVLNPHLADVSCPHWSTLNIFFLQVRCGLDQMLLKEEGKNGGLGKISSFVVDQPSLKLKVDQLPRVDWLLGEKSWEPGVVQ